MGKESIKIRDGYLNKIEKPWVRGGPLSTYDVTLKELKSYLEKGNPEMKVKAVDRKGGSLVIKYKGKNIDLTPIEEFAHI